MHYQFPDEVERDPSQPVIIEKLLTGTFLAPCATSRRTGRRLLGDPALDRVVIDPGLGRRRDLLAFARFERQLLKALVAPIGVRARRRARSWRHLPLGSAPPARRRSPVPRSHHRPTWQRLRARRPNPCLRQIRGSSRRACRDQRQDANRAAQARLPVAAKRWLRPSRSGRAE
jgi:hypothetical protein